MKITTAEQTESISDIVCDVCGSSTRIEGHGWQFGTLHASWGYGSSHEGERYEVHLCDPCFFRTLSAYLDWISAAGIVRGAVFRRLDRWGHLSEDALHPGSLISLLRQILRRAGISAELYTSHSLRRGFATWATANGWDLKGLMTYVGWKDIKSAMRYIDPTISFGGLAVRPAVESNTGTLTQLPASH